ncbi:AAA family ATPase [Prosthecobacter sp.]|uniref:AAA family ATPase n=1 Tax=Prosthecobacter sp. TaxID=1965333 RepID=UPI003784B675
MNEAPHSSPHSFVVCGNAETDSFAPTYRGPHTPVLAAFGGGSMHRFRMNGHWDLERAAAENTGSLLRSHKQFDQNKPLWDDLTFQFSTLSLLYADENRLEGYASSAAEAEAVVRQFAKNYARPPEPEAGSYSLIRVDKDIGRVNVPLAAESLLSDEIFTLHYTEATVVWHRDFVQRLTTRKNGLAILEGPPGTGKTSYLRHLMGVLRESHRFYFIPASTLRVLSDPNFIGFWADQRRRYQDKQFAVILEDSDAALMARGADNREQVSAILNLTDGMLADFLRLQILCTINGRATDIDQALLRPGRLITHRVFPRLSREHASLLAANLGRSLPTACDYSLAEIFADPETCEARKPRIGFSA